MGQQTKQPADSDTNVPENGAQQEETERSNKRRRIGIACTACRIRKSRCSGTRPRCEPCERLGFECVYETPESAANLIISKDHFGSLERRVKLLEETVHVIQCSHVSQGCNDTNRVSSSSSRRRSSTVSTRSNQFPDSTTSISIRIDDSPDQGADHTKTDGMAITLVDEENPVYFGPSSNIAFMRHISTALSGLYCTNGETSVPMKDSARKPDPQRSTSRKSQDRTSLQGKQDSQIGVNMIPSCSKIEALLDAYFSNTGLLFPFIHKESFLETYYQLKEHNFTKGIRRSWIGLLNIILAMATTTTALTSGSSELEGRENDANAADVFYRRAEEVYNGHILNGTNLETVQSLLLTTQYLQGTQKSSQTWITHGLAVQAALAIGLQSKAVLHKLPPVEQEMRMRTWYGCVVLDRSLSMTLGRPCLIQEDYHVLSLPKLMSYPGEGASVSFFLSAIALYKILYKILQTLYGNNNDSDEIAPQQTHLITSTFTFSQELADWKASLPNHLRLTSISNLQSANQPPNDKEERYRYVLTVRYLYNQLLLHRPVMSWSLANSRRAVETAIPSSMNQIERNLNLSCVNYAKEIISIVHWTLTKRVQGKQIIGARWFTLYYTFNAALIIFGSCLVPLDMECASICSRERLGQGEQLIQQAIQCLQCLDDGSKTSDRCIRYLKHLVTLLQRWMQDDSGPLSTGQRFLSTPQMSGVFPTPQDVSSGSEPVAPMAMGYNSNENQDSMVDFLMGDANVPIGNIDLGPFFSNEFQRWFYCDV